MKDQQIVACVDRSAYSVAVADGATWAAQKLSAPIEFMHVIDRHLEQGSGEDHSGAIGFNAQENLLTKLSDTESEKSRIARTQGRLFLNGLRSRAIENRVEKADSRLRHGTVVDCLLERIDHTRLIVIGRRGESSPNSARDIGRTFESAVRAVKCPVLGVHDAFSVPQRFLFAYDDSAISRRGIQTILDSKLFEGMTGTLLMCGKRNSKQLELLEQTADTLTQAGVTTEFRHLEGETVTQIIKALDLFEADLLVMGAYTHAPLRSLFFGSKTDDILRATRVPALLLR